MPEKTVSGSGKASGASEVEAGAPEPTKATKTPKAPKKIKVEAGGHVAYVDPPAPTPEPINTCSICGQDPETCPHGDTQGWTIEGG